VPNTLLVISDLSRLECRVKSLRENNRDLLDSYDQFFREVVHQIVPLTTDVIDLAMEIHANFGFATPDALHLAAAIEANCDTFFTNDQRLQRFHRIRVVVVSVST
jgi:predicted nucleic acid-binding protein